MIISYNPVINRGDMNTFYKYEIKMINYMQNELNLDFSQFSLYFDEIRRYHFDFVIGDYFYTFFGDSINLVNYIYNGEDINFPSDGIDMDEYFNLAMSHEISHVVTKDMVLKLRSKAKEIVDECTKEIKVLLGENA